MQKKEYMLSDAISPENYELFFEPDLKNFRFRGNVKISLNIKEPSSKIILNCSELKIGDVKIITKNGVIKPRVKLNEKHERLELNLKKPISKGAIIEIDFEGVLNDKLYGFYRSRYLDKGKEKYLATTQFEAPYARRAFPCFDQPDKKATFFVTLKIPKDLKAISNMPAASEKISGQSKIIKFQKTPLMSTYLLYFGVGDFEFMQTRYKNKTIRVVTTPGKAKQGKLALELATKFLKYFEDFSDVKYPLPKLDLIAIPDFAAGAMENWGAITFREVILLYDKEKTSLQIKKRIAEVIAHELWHQWSGNLVTMKWWDDLWLNESFATYMAYKAVDHYFPEWNMFEDFVAAETYRAFSEDSLKTTHPIAVHVNSPNEIEEIFDGISYGKGGSVLRMIESYLGSETFRKGVSNYLKKYKYKNAHASDLWNELAGVSSVPIKKIMESWIQQPGHPLLKAKRDRDKLTITQEKFNAFRNDKTIWLIPLTIRSSSGEIKTLLEGKSKIIELPENTEWYKININQEGFYRVQYDKESLERLKTLISKKQLSAFDRAGIQNDLFDLTRMQEEYLDVYLDFIRAYAFEDNQFVLSEIYSNIYSIYQIFSQEKSWEKIWPRFKNHLNEPFEKAFKSLGWEPSGEETHNEALLRPLVISYLAFSENQEIINMGLKKFQQYLNSQKIHPDLANPIFTIAARHNGGEIYNNLLVAYDKTQDIERKMKLLASLYKFRNSELLKKSLDFALTEKVRIQDLRTVFATINTNPEIKPIYLNWAKINWKKLAKYQKVHFVFMTLLMSLITTYTGKEKENEIRGFLNSKKVAYKKTQANSFEIMQINTRWLERNKGVLEGYFS